MRIRVRMRAWSYFEVFLRFCTSSKVPKQRTGADSAQATESISPNVVDESTFKISSSLLEVKLNGTHCCPPDELQANHTVSNNISNIGQIELLTLSSPVSVGKTF